MTVRRDFRWKLKKLLYAGGVLSLYRWMFHAQTLTVVMFHRVMPTSDARYATADPDYTMSLANFERCADAMAARYNVVSLEAVLLAAQNAKPLPRNALLITFDDGWEDTARYAIPALQQRGLPCAVFIPSDILESGLVMWKDIAGCIWRADKLSNGLHVCERFASPAELVHWLADLTPEERSRWIAAELEPHRTKIEPLMMSHAQLQEVLGRGAAIGGHGATHTPLTEVASAEAELSACYRKLEKHLDHPATAMSFPHGLHSPSICAQAKAQGFQVLFTSEAAINRLAAGRPTSSVLGRIDMSEKGVRGPEQSVTPWGTAWWLAPRPMRR